MFFISLQHTPMKNTQTHTGTYNTQQMHTFVQFYVIKTKYQKYKIPVGKVKKVLTLLLLITIDRNTDKYTGLTRYSIAVSLTSQQSQEQYI